LIYNTSYTENILCKQYQYDEGGTHLQGFRTGLTRSLKKYADASGMLDKLKFDVSGDDFPTAIISVKVAEPQFEGQTKTKLGNREVVFSESGSE
jgi:DNA gyrase subunit B